MADRPDPAFPFTLAEACEHLLGGQKKPADLQAAHAKGELALEKWGRRYMVTPRAIARWQGWTKERLASLMPESLPRYNEQTTIYVIAAGDCVKIGKSANVARRVKALSTGTPHPPRVLATFHGSPKTERSLHDRFSAYRLNGEWFRKEGALADWIGAGCPAEDRT